MTKTKTKTLSDIVYEIRLAEVEAELQSVTGFIGEGYDDLVEKAYSALKKCIADNIRPGSAELFLGKLAWTGKYEQALALMEPEHAKHVFGQMIADYSTAKSYDQVRTVVEVLKKAGIQEVYEYTKDDQ